MNDIKKAPLRIIRGDTICLDVNVSDAGGDPWTLQDGEKLIFGVKATPNSTAYLIKKTVESGTSPFRVALTPADTGDMALGIYHYDVGLQSGENYYHVIPTSAFTVCSNITGWEE